MVSNVLSTPQVPEQQEQATLEEEKVGVGAYVSLFLRSVSFQEFFTKCLKPIAG